MLRIGKNPKDSGEAKASTEKQEQLADPMEIQTAAASAPANEYNIQSSVAPEEEVLLSIPHREFERLSVKTTEVLAEAAFAQQRIGKDQEEIEQLKTETRALLAQLRAA